MQCHQTARASCVNGHTGSVEIKKPADTVRQKCIADTSWFILDAGLRVRIEDSEVVMVEATDEYRGIGSHNICHWQAGILQCMVNIFQNEPLLGIQCQKLIPCDVEERAIEEGWVFGKKVSPLDMKLFIFIGQSIFIKIHT